MRLGRNVEVRPLGGGLGCLAMIVVSIVASVLLRVAHRFALISIMRAAVSSASGRTTHRTFLLFSRRIASSR